MSGRPWWNLEPCGTVAAAKRHYRRGERPCPACLAARAADNRFRMRAWRARKAAEVGAAQAGERSRAA